MMQGERVARLLQELVAGAAPGADGLRHLLGAQREARAIDAALEADIARAEASFTDEELEQLTEGL